LDDHPDDRLDSDERPRRLVHHAPLRRWSPVSRDERKRTRAFIDQLTEFPYMTVGTCVFLGWVFLVQLVVGWPFTFLLPPGAGGQALDGLVSGILGDRLGWLSGSAVFAGEGWRLLTATMLHGSLVHVAGNAAVLYFLGRIVENVYGRGAFVVAYVGAGASGTVLSAIVSEGNSVGASGAVLGMLGVMVVLGIKHRHDIPEPLRDYFRTDMWVFVGLVALLSALPMVDWAGHLGGFLFGIVVGVAWPARRIVGPPTGRALLVTQGLVGLALGSFLFCAAVLGTRVMEMQEYLPHEDLHALAAAIERGDRGAMRRVATRLDDRFGDQEALMGNLAATFTQVGEYERARATWLRYEEAGAPGAIGEAWQNDLAWTLLMGWPDDPDTVAQALRRVGAALREDPSSDAMLNTRAYGLVLAGDYAEGEELSRELMEGKSLRGSRQADVYIHVLALIGLGRVDEARAEFDDYAADFPTGEATMADIALIKDRAEAALSAE